MTGGLGVAKVQKKKSVRGQARTLFSKAVDEKIFHPLHSNRLDVTL